jgi:DNA primase
MSIVDEVKQKNDIVEVIGQYTTLKKAGRTYRGLCPFHSEKTPSFFVYPEQQSWHCFGACNTGGDVFAFIMKKQGVGFGDALRLLADRTGIIVPVKMERKEDRDEKDRLYEINQTAAQYFQQQLTAGAAEKARGYLMKRGVSLKTITQFQLGYAADEWEALKGYLTGIGYTEKDILTAGLIIAGENGRSHDRFRNKIMIPIFDTKGRVTGFGSRVLDDSQPKYVNSPQTPVFDKSGSLYGINFAADSIRKQDMVVIVEGYMDVIIPHQYGITNVVASMGTAINEKQITIIKRLTKNVALALDPDAAGEEAMQRGVNYENALDAEVKVIRLPEGKDPDELIKEDPNQWTGVVSNAIPVIDFIFETVTAGLNLTRVQDKTKAVDKLLPIVNGINNDIRRDHYLNKLAEMTGTSYHNMELASSKLKAAQKKGLTLIPKEETSRQLLYNPGEEYLLSLLLQNPELKQITEPLPPEYFESTENREIYLGWLINPDTSVLKESLDNTIREHLELLLEKKIRRTTSSKWTSEQWEKFDTLIGGKPSGAQIEKKYNDSLQKLKIQYLRNLEEKKSQVLALERESGDTNSDLAKLVEQGTDVSDNLKTVFTQRGHIQRR